MDYRTYQCLVCSMIEIVARAHHTHQDQQSQFLHGNRTEVNKLQIKLYIPIDKFKSHAQASLRDASGVLGFAGGCNSANECATSCSTHDESKAVQERGTGAVTVDSAIATSCAIYSTKV